MKKALANMFWRMGDKLSLGYDAGDSQRVRRDLGWGRNTPKDEDRMVGAGDSTRETIRLKSYDLRRNNAVVSGVCERLASFAVGGTGLNPQARTSNTDWNRSAEQWWAEWSKVCDARGRIDMRMLQWLAISMRPTHGGMYLQLLDNGQIMPIECERIRRPSSKDSVQKAYPDGVKVAGNGKPVAYWVHDRDANGSFSQRHAERPVQAEYMVPVISPPWRLDQVREIPDLAPIVPHLQDIHEMNTHTLNTAKVQAMIVAALKKNGGMGLNGLPRGSNSATNTVGTRQTFKFDWGQVLEMFPGEELDMGQSATPNAEHIPYIKMQLMLCASALNRPYEFFTLDFQNADFSRMKAILLMCNRASRDDQAWLVSYMMKRLWNWRIAKAIKEKELPPAPIETRNGMNVSEWYKVEWQGPEEPWLDRQEAQQADVLEIQAGLNTFSRASKRRGGDFEDTLREKAQDQMTINRVAQEYGLDPQQLVMLQIPGQQAPATGNGDGNAKPNI